MQFLCQSSDFSFSKLIITTSSDSLVRISDGGGGVGSRGWGVLIYLILKL